MKELGDEQLGYNTSGSLNSGYDQKFGDDQLGYDKPECVDLDYDLKLREDHLGYDTSGLPQLGLRPEAREQTSREDSGVSGDAHCGAVDTLRGDRCARGGEGPQ